MVTNQDKSGGKLDWKLKQTYMRTIMNLKNAFTLLLFSTLAACGGGGSDSGPDGSDPSLNVSSCITVDTEFSSGTGFTTNIFTNTCNFQVNFTAVLGPNISAPIPLSEGQSYKSIIAQTTKFIACRPPSVGVNRAEFPNVTLDCD